MLEGDTEAKRGGAHCTGQVAGNGWLRQEDCEFKASLDNKVRHYLQETTIKTKPNRQKKHADVMA